MGSETIRGDSETRNIEDHLDLDMQVPVERVPKKVLLIPYIPGISDRLKIIAHRNGVRSWYSYSGRIGDGLSATYKDRVHVSKQRHAVYKASCICGILYIGETDRNLKVRISEHKNATSVSSLSENLRIGRRFEGSAHRLAYNH